MGKRKQIPPGFIDNWNNSGVLRLLPESGRVHLNRSFVFEYEGKQYPITMPQPSTAFEAWNAVAILGKDGKPAYSQVKLISVSV